MSFKAYINQTNGELDGVTTTKWGYVTDQNQSTTTTSSPTFATMELDNLGPSGVGLTIDNTLSTNHALSIVSDQAAQGDADYLVNIQATNASYNQPVVFIESKGTAGGNAPCLRLDSDANCHIEFIETDQTSPAGKFELGAQSNRFQLNSRKGTDDGFETVVSFPQLAQTSQPITSYKGLKVEAEPTASVAQLELEGESTSMRFFENDQVNPIVKWEFQAQSARMKLNSRNTGDTAYETIMELPALSQTSLPVKISKNVTIESTPTASLGQLELTGTSCSLRMNESDQTAPQGLYEIAATGNRLNINSRNAANDAYETIIEIPQLAQTANNILVNKETTFIEPIVMPSSANADAANNSLYYSTDSSKLVYKDSGGTVYALY